MGGKHVLGVSTASGGGSGDDGGSGGGRRQRWHADRAPSGPAFLSGSASERVSTGQEVEGVGVWREGAGERCGDSIHSKHTGQRKYT